MAEKPVINPGKCQGCGLCVSVCACGALVIVGNIVTVTEVVECSWCTLCELVCPNEAICCPFEIVLEDR
jgi:MinD superfamily P-loop ATPase